jgi:hypothetical protein
MSGTTTTTLPLAAAVGAAVVTGATGVAGAAGAAGAAAGAAAAGGRCGRRSRLGAAGGLEFEDQVADVDLVAQLELERAHHAAVAAGDLHRGLVALDGEQALLGTDGVALLDQHLDDGDILEVPDVGDLDLNQGHGVRFPQAYSGLILSASMPYRAIASATIGGRQPALVGQGLECGHHDVVAVHLEVLAQARAEIAAAEAVGAQHAVATAGRDEGADLLGIALHVVGAGHHRALRAPELPGHEALAPGLQRVQQVPALGVLALARQFVEARAAPQIGADAPVGLQQFLGRHRLAQDGAAAQQVDLQGARQRPAAAGTCPGGSRPRCRAAGRAWRIVLVEQGQVEEHVLLVLRTMRCRPSCA